MKNLKLFSLIVVFVLAFFVSSTLTFAEELKVYAKYTVNNLTFTSYSKSWTEKDLKELYKELLNNFHSEEFDYLKDIYIYPDSPQGVNGYYNEDINIKDSKYTFGKNCYIELFNGEKLNTIEKIAPILSHEYGHHYTLYNLLKYEDIYYNNFEKSEYYKLRELSKYPVNWEYINEEQYVYHWDITEILADDYVQLLGSANAKHSTDFKDIKELAQGGGSLPNFYNNSFNLKPQLNPYLPLASEVDGLYNYFLKIAGFTAKSPSLTSRPEFLNLTAKKTSSGDTTFKLSFTPAETEDSEPLEYTVLMYPKENPFAAIPVKTLSSKEELTAFFGSYEFKNPDGSVSNISQNLPEEVVLKIYTKNSKNFIYSSNTISFNLKDVESQIEANIAANKAVAAPKTPTKPPAKTPTSVKPTKNTQKSSGSNKKERPYLLEKTFVAMIKHLKS